MDGSAWEALFFLLALKIPVVFVGAVVWRAIKDVPTPEEEAPVEAKPVPDTPPGAPAWSERRAPRRPVPTRPSRRPAPHRHAATRNLESRPNLESRQSPESR